jgi:translation initiation factor 3 subunit C
MPRFFRQAGDSDSESEESEDELMSSEDEAPQRPTTTAKPALASFLRGGADSSSSDDEESESESDDDESDEDRPQTRILSAVDKRLKEIEGTGVVIENALRINDWVAISNGSCLDTGWKFLSKRVL